LCLVFALAAPVGMVQQPRPYLIKLLESGEMPFRLVGTHRRIRFQDLREYKSRDDLARRRSADELLS
jgi:excisionase family DNA binding protein